MKYEFRMTTEEWRYRVAVLEELQAIRSLLEANRTASNVAAEPQGLGDTPITERAQKRRGRVKKGEIENGTESEDRRLRNGRRAGRTGNE